MNNSSGKLNPSQSTMKKTGLTNKNMDMDYNTGMGQSGKEFGTNSSNAASLKGKLQNLEDSVANVSDEMGGHKRDVKQLNIEKDMMQDNLSKRAHEVKTILLQELSKVEDEMKRHVTHQKSENARLQQFIAQLKTDKTMLQNQLLSLQRRMNDLELQVGSDDVKFG
jgi:chromosome segregation ATPase